MFRGMAEDFLEHREGYTLREMRERDFDDVVRLEEEIFPEAWMRDDFETALGNRDQLFLVVEKEGHVAAYCGSWLIVDCTEILNIATAVEHRKQGLARWMLEVVRRESEREGAVCFQLEVREHNLPAISLYESCGFKVVGRRKNYYNHPKEDAILMTCEHE